MYHCAIHNCFLQWCDGHVPGIDDLTLVVFALRYMYLHLRRLMPPKVGQIVVVLLTNAWKLGPGGKQSTYRVKTLGRTIFKDAPEESETRRTPAVSDASLRPPEDVF